MSPEVTELRLTLQDVTDPHDPLKLLVSNVIALETAAAVGPFSVAGPLIATCGHINRA